MTEKLKQSLSAAIDDEAEPFELRRVLDELDRDAGLRALWDRYHIVGSVLRGERAWIPPSLRERVWQTLEDATGESAEPGAMTAVDSAEDLAHAEAHAEARAEARATPSGTSRRFGLGRYAALAVAATVAFAVVLGLSGLRLGGGKDVGTLEIAGSGSPGVTELPAGSTALAGVSGPRLRLTSEVSPSDVQRAQAYMLHHTQQQALNNQAGVMSLVKMVTYEAP